MQGHAEQCVEKYLELTNTEINTLKPVQTHQGHQEDVTVAREILEKIKIRSVATRKAQAAQSKLRSAAILRDALEDEVKVAAAEENLAATLEETMTRQIARKQEKPKDFVPRLGTSLLSEWQNDTSKKRSFSTPVNESGLEGLRSKRARGSKR